MTIIMESFFHDLHVIWGKKSIQNTDGKGCINWMGALILFFLMFLIKLVKKCPFLWFFSLICCTCCMYFISPIYISCLLFRCCATELQAEIGQPIDWHSLTRDSPGPWLQLWTALWTLPWKFLLKVIFFGKLCFILQFYMLSHIEDQLYLSFFLS
jgi:hypothetical protein